MIHRKEVTSLLCMAEHGDQLFKSRSDTRACSALVLGGRHHPGGQRSFQLARASGRHHSRLRIRGRYSHRGCICVPHCAGNKHRGNCMVAHFASPLDARKSDSAKIEETKPYLSDAIVVSGKDGTVPSFRARFARNGRDAAFYIEYSVFFGGVGGGWTVPITVPIQTVGRFTRGETIPIPLMRVVETREGPRWQFGEEMKNGFPVHMIGGGHIYRGRVQFPVSGRRCSILLFCRSVP